MMIQSRFCLKLGGKVRAKLFGKMEGKFLEKTQNESEGRKRVDHVCLKICQLYTRKICAMKKIVHTAVGKSLIILSSHWTSKLNNSRHFHSY